MYRFLVVGLGGSGGRTLQFMVDQMLTDLRKRGWQSEKLPACWQFVHVDVPANPDGVQAGVPDPITVRDRGRYIGIGTSYDSYPPMDQTVMARLAQGDRLRDAAVWRPEPRDAKEVPIHLGAGQYRAVGRVATLNKAQEILDGLTASAEAMYTPQAANDLEWLHRAFNRPMDAVTTALPIVVSSIAGGSGASMILDVCNLMRAITVSGFRADPMAFLYTPDVFEQLPPSSRGGVEPNALAAISEIMAAQAAGETSWAPSEWNIYGVRQVPPPGAGRGPASVDLVGARNSLTGARFGDGTTNTIYRGLGRSLAAMILSPDSQVDILAHRVGNFSSRASSGLDRSQLGALPDTAGRPVAFDAIGFASIGLGRDRFAEYSAQRLARSALDTLVRPAAPNQSAAEAQAAARQHAEEGVREFGAIVGWDTQHPFEIFWSTASRQQKVMSVFAPSGHGNEVGAMSRDGWSDHLRGISSTAARRLDQLVDNDVLGMSDVFAARLQSRVEQAAVVVASRHGLSAAITVLEEVNRRVNELVGELRRTGTVNSAEFDAAFGDLSAAPTKGTLAPGLVDRVTGKLFGALLTRMSARLQAPAADVLAALTTDVVLPLRDAFRAVERDLTDLRREATQQGGANIETLNVAAWPVGDEVPARFATGVNEVLIEPIDGYARRYDLLMAASFDMPPNASGSAVGAAVSEVVTGLRHGSFATAEAVSGMEELVRATTVGDDTFAELVSVGRQGTWVPAALVALAVRTRETRTSSRPAYRPTLMAADLLASARAWINRSGAYRFSEFIRMGLADYIGGADRRVAEEFSGQFARALELAAPLIGVEPNMLNGVHGIPNVAIRYEFTPVPLTDGQAAPIREHLRAQSGIDDDSVSRFDGALTTDRAIAQIDIIGNYAKPFSAAVFRSLQEPINAAWSNAVQTNRLSQFWQWRRGRTLADFLPVSPAWQQAMITGWLVGRITGELLLPGELEGTRSAQVYSAAARRYIPFEEQVVPRSGSHDAVYGWEWAPALLETMPVAIARCANDPELSALVPYQLLRDLGIRESGAFEVDLNPNAPVARGARQALVSWLDRGTARDGARPSAVRGIRSAEGPAVTWTERMVGARGWLSDTVRPRFAEQLPAQPGRARGSGEWASPTVHNLSEFPREFELSEQFVVAVDQVSRELDLIEKHKARQRDSGDF